MGLSEAEGVGVRLRRLPLTALLWIVVAGSASAAVPFAVGQVHYGGGGDWYSSAASITNWLGEVRARVGIRTETEPRIVRLSDRDLYRTPFIYMNGHGDVRLSDAEVEGLRRYLTLGGFVFVNDDYGLDQSFRRELAKVFPESPIVPLASEHPIYHCFYDMAGLPKVHEHDGDPARGFGVVHEGRLVVFYAWSSDVGDGLEAFDVHKDPEPVREAAIRMAVNIVVYALTH